MIAVSAVFSYLIVKKVSVVAVVAAVVAAISLEGLLAPSAYFDYFASYSVRGPWVPNEQNTDEVGAVFLVCLLHARG
jgi:hypothetical protein